MTVPPKWLATGVALALAAPGAWSAENYLQQAYLKASNADIRDGFGSAVAMWGNTLVVGAPAEASRGTGVDSDAADNGSAFSGAAYVFVRDGGRWIQQAYLKPSNTGTGDAFGSTVAVYRNTIVVGAPFEDSDAVGVDADDSNDDRSNSGAAYVFVRNGSTWIQQAFLKASNPDENDNFGWSVAVAEDTVVVGARWEDGDAIGIDGESNNRAEDAGAAYVFVRNGDAWEQEAYLKSDRSSAGDSFGEAVGLAGQFALVGAPREDHTGEDAAGAAYVFERAGQAWQLHSRLTAADPGRADNFGHAVSISGETLVIGAPREDSLTGAVNGDEFNDNSPLSGAAYVYARDGATWTRQAFLKSHNADPNDRFGQSVSIAGDIVLVGAHREDSASVGVDGDRDDERERDSGAAYVFRRDGATWSFGNYLKASNTADESEFGWAVAVAGETLIVGSRWESGDRNGIENTEAVATGAIYVFDLPAKTIGGIRSISTDGDVRCLTIPPAFGRDIGVEYSSDLSPGSWIELGNFFFEVNSEGIFIDPDPTRTSRPTGYYRAFLRPVVSP